MSPQPSGPAETHPNRYVLHHHLVLLTYDVTSLDGQPRLLYQVEQGPAARTFVGDQIDVQESQLGSLVTVTLHVSPDEGASLLTLLLPPINMGETCEQAFETIAIFTRERSSIGGPGLLTGALHTYEEIHLKGTALVVAS
jgi:hypothetical protein